MTTTPAARLLVAHAASALPVARSRDETVHALTRLELLVGFRDPARTAALLADLHLSWTDDLAARLLRPAGLRDVLELVRSTPAATLARQLHDLGGAARAAETAAHRASAGRRRPHPPEHPDRESLRGHALVARLAEEHPHDAGVAVAMLLNHVVLAPGERVAVAAGTVLAHADGLGVGASATSDAPPPLPGPVPTHPRPVRLRRPSGPGSARTMDPGALVVHAVLGAGVVLQPEPQVVLCLEGPVVLTDAAGTTRLERGASARLGEVEGPVTVRGVGRVAVHRSPAPAYPAVARRAA